MYCPKCNKEYDGKFCPECGTKLIEKPAPSGVSLNLGDANAISGGLHVSDSHAVHNEDKSIHNITNTTSTVNNITQVSAQKTELELLQERKTQYLNACKRAYEDNVLEQREVVELEELRIKMGLDKTTADNILESVRVMSDRNARKSELNPIAKTKLKILTSNLQKNEVKALMDQIDSLEPLVRRYDHDELSRKYYLVLAALKPEKCIEQKERTKTDTYWEAFWSYLAYIKAGRLIDAEETLASLDHFSSYPEDNMTVLAAAGALMMRHTDEAKEYLDAAMGEYTPALQRFVDSIYLLIEPETAKEMGADEDTCAFYLVNFFGQNEAKAEEEDRRRQEVISNRYNYHPKTKRELEDIIDERIEEEGLECDLNDIDTSEITDMKDLFLGYGIFKDNDFNGDISQWDVSNVKDMSRMFWGCKEFNCDLSNWDVSSVEKTFLMFGGCVKFEGRGLANWDVSKCKDMHAMFLGCKELKCDLSNWDISNVEDMDDIFQDCKSSPNWYKE